MSNFSSENPIAIFDSGIGGLTVAKTIVEKLPSESIIYFGDTAHLPYGDKSAKVIQSYARSIVDFLIPKGAKLILIACNSASAAAYSYLSEYIGDKSLLVNVIDPVVSYLGTGYRDKKIGLIGTKQTVNSKEYSRKLAAYGIELKSLATPLLAPMIEEGFFDHQVVDIVLKEYLSRDILADVDTLVLGCTHYPLIQEKIKDYYLNQVEVIDSSEIVASAIKKLLTDRDLLANGPSNRSFYVSDINDNFVQSAKLFFGDEIKVLEEALIN